MTLQQQSVLLAKFRQLLAEQGPGIDPSLRSTYSNLYTKIARNLLYNVHNMDVTSLASTINVLSKKNQGIAIELFVPD